MAPLVRLVKLNGLQYNRNRDPQAYRRAPGVPFRIQALIEGRGDARVALIAEDGATLASDTVAAPATWAHELTYGEPGSRLVRLEASRGAERYVVDLRLDVVAPAHA